MYVDPASRICQRIPTRLILERLPVIHQCKTEMHQTQLQHDLGRNANENTKERVKNSLRSRTNL